MYYGTVFMAVGAAFAPLAFWANDAESLWFAIVMFVVGGVLRRLKV